MDADDITDIVADERELVVTGGKTDEVAEMTEGTDEEGETVPDNELILVVGGTDTVDELIEELDDVLEAEELVVLATERALELEIEEDVITLETGSGEPEMVLLVAVETALEEAAGCVEPPGEVALVAEL